jgi:hypothetical protein
MIFNSEVWMFCHYKTRTYIKLHILLFGNISFGNGLEQIFSNYTNQIKNQLYCKTRVHTLNFFIKMSNKFVVSWKLCPTIQMYMIWLCSCTANCDQLKRQVVNMSTSRDKKCFICLYFRSYNQIWSMYKVC